MTPVAYMDSLGLFEYGGTLFHGVHMDEDDFRIIRERGIYVVTNPASNLKLASGIAPIKRYLEEGIPLAIGTDGPASNNCLDMFREMFLTTGLQKAVCEDPEAVPAIEVLKMATTGGAHAMGLSECDCIQAGKKADLDPDRSEPAEYAAASESGEKSCVQRFQAECQNDDGRRKCAVSGWGVLSGLSKRRNF